MKKCTYLKLVKYAENNGWTLVSTIENDPNKPLLWRKKDNNEEILRRFETIKKNGFISKIGANQFHSNKDYYDDLSAFCIKKNIKIISDLTRPVRKKVKILLEDDNGIFCLSFEQLLNINFPRKNKRTIEDLNEIARSKGGRCLSKTYLGPHVKHLFEDSSGNQWEAEANSIWCGTWSQFDANKLKGNYHRLNNEIVRQLLIEREYIWISGEYENAKSKLKVSCKKNHIWIIDTDHLINQNNDCPQCFGRISKGQAEVMGWIQSIYPSAKSLIFNIDGVRVECDIFIPELNVGIEYNGLYWHSEEVSKYTHNMARKTKLFSSLSIKIIHIYDDEWINRKEQVKNFIRSKINNFDNIIYARKCVVEPIQLKDAVNFINMHHIQECMTGIKYAFGIIYDNEIIGAMTFGNHHRENKNAIIVLNRMVFKNGTRIIGGASKMLNLATKNLPKTFKKIITWSDNRWSDGNVYKKIGFNNVADLSPDYYYVFKNNRMTKQSCKKNILHQRGGIGKTEKELAASLKYMTIFDCGKKKWEYIL